MSPPPGKKETLAQVYSCEFCEILKNIFFIEHLWWLLLNFDDVFPTGFSQSLHPLNTVIIYLYLSLVSAIGGRLAHFFNINKWGLDWLQNFGFWVKV